MERPLIHSGEIAGAFVVRDAHWRSKIFIGGLLLILVPFGWPVALGFRKALITRLHSGTQPLLPEWKGQTTRYFFDGLKAMGVIFGYLAPLYICLMLLLLGHGVIPNVTWLYGVLFFSVFTIFSTLSFPCALLYWTFFSEQYRVPAIFALALFTAFVLVVFFIPAAFLQVSKTGHYRAAFDLGSAARILRKNFCSYLRAWGNSIQLSLAGHFALPFAPWGVVWCYLGIIYEFNSILAEEVQGGLNGSWFDKLHHDETIVVGSTRLGYVLRCLNVFDATGKPCFFLKFGTVLLPLPDIAARILRVGRV